MRGFQGLSHTKRDCKHHVVFILKRCKRAIFGAIRERLREVLHEWVRQRECLVVEGYFMRGHVHMFISIPPERSVSYAVGYIKARGALSIARSFIVKTKIFTAENFSARVYFVLTVRLDEEMTRAYIRNQEREDERYNQFKLGT